MPKIEVLCTCATTPVMCGIAECPVHRKPKPKYARNPDVCDTDETRPLRYEGDSNAR